MATSQSPVALTGQPAPQSAFDQLFGMAAGIGLDILKSKGEAIVARDAVKTEVSKQAAYTKLAQTSSNLGPNDVRGGVGAAVENTELTFGVSPAQVLAAGKKNPLIAVVVLGLVGWLVWKAFR